MTRRSKSDPQRISARERQREALELRKQGLPFEAIAQKVGYRSRQAAAYGVEAALRRITQRPAQELKKLDIERLDMLFLFLMKRIRRGDPKAIIAALRIMERRAKLLGLDMPTEEHITGKIQLEPLPDLSGKSDAELNAALAEVERILGVNPEPIA